MNSTLIHPSAVIDPTAQLGRNVRVGPGAVIEAGCVIGDDCEIRAHAIITGAARLGVGNQIGYSAVVGAEPQDLGYKGAPTRVVIGDRNILRELVTIHRGTKEGTETVIGNDNFLMTGAHVAHNCHIGNHVIIVNNVLLAGHVEIQDRAFLGGGSVVHQFTRVGELAIMRGLTRISKDVPPYFMAVDTNRVGGVNRVGMKRAGFSPEVRRSVVEAFKLLHRSTLNFPQALEQLEKESPTPEVQKIITFIRTSKRGICAGSRRDTEDEE
ncbi:MAG: acyl-[acyl-carrier-protein]--UDP-N-acetylglucosamine O-acyltransferase [Verrucomicrobia bacterium Tous-C9LFEB]|nr:MAG: acyl-[acyl-carrier-protein]--UDP-N-acetylglucosamine O-acyltransferase [Verrucomicrobia bacterium Tous-C9LFEB]